MLIRQKYAPAPTITPLAGTLLSHATIEEGIEWPETAGLFESLNCLSVDHVSLFPCPTVPLEEPVLATTTATTGGSLAVGTYFVVVTAVNRTGETLISNRESETTTGATSIITASWAAVTGATSYRVYVTDGASGSELLLAETDELEYVITTIAGAAGTFPVASTAVQVSVKTFEGPSWQDGFRFAVHGGFTCKLEDMEPRQAELEAVFRARESAGVERALMQTRFIDGADWDAATILTTPTDPSPEVALALLEGYAASNYAGVPTLHVPRSIGALLFRNGSIVSEGGKFYTPQGSKVVSGGGYEYPNSSPTGATAADDERWLYASGEVLVGRSDLILRAELDRNTNEERVLVERFYMVAVDCFTAAAKVKVK